MLRGRQPSAGLAMRRRVCGHIGEETSCLTTLCCFFFVGRRQDRRKRSKLGDGKRSSRRARPSVPALSNEGKAQLARFDAGQVSREGWGGRLAAPPSLLGIAIDWVVDRSSLTGVEGTGGDGLMYSQAIVRTKVRAMPCAERAAVKSCGARGTGIARVGRRAGSVLGTVVTPGLRSLSDAKPNAKQSRM